MNLDNPKVYSETSIFDGLVSCLEPAASVISTTLPSSALSQWWLQRRRDHVQVTFPGLGQRRKTETETVTDTKTIKYVGRRQRHKDNYETIRGWLLSLSWSK